MTTQDAESVKPTGVYSALKDLFKKPIGAIRSFFKRAISLDVNGRGLSVVDWAEIICIGIGVILLGAIVFSLIVAYFVFVIALICLLVLFVISLLLSIIVIAVWMIGLIFGQNIDWLGQYTYLFQFN